MNLALDAREQLLLTTNKGFSQERAAVVCAILESVFDINPSIEMTAP